VNFSSLLARCLESGVNDKYSNRSGYARLCISESHPPSLQWDCCIIDEEFFTTVVRGSDSERRRPKKRQICRARKFKEVADDMEDKESELYSAINRAYGRMISFRPEEIFCVRGRE
jgi:hypothetical protein